MVHSVLAQCNLSIRETLGTFKVSLFGGSVIHEYIYISAGQIQVSLIKRYTLFQGVPFQRLLHCEVLTCSMTMSLSYIMPRG